MPRPGRCWPSSPAPARWRPGAASASPSGRPERRPQPVALAGGGGFGRVAGPVAEPCMRLPPLAPRIAVLLLGWLAMTPPARAAEPVQLLAAGSLRAAFTELTAAFRTAPGGAEVSATF